MLKPRTKNKRVFDIPIAELNQILQRPEVKKRFAADGIEALGSTPEHFGDYVKAEITRWAKVVKDAGVKLE
jgi:tripartite-type tricarboxylate transporter receptor subunit TctC